MTPNSNSKVGQPDCSNHRKDLFGQTDMKVMAEAIGDLHYETLDDLLFELMCKLARDSGKDAASGRVGLATHLISAADHIGDAKNSIRQAAKISKPFMPASTPPVNTNERLFTLDEWIRVEDRPLFIIDEKRNWTCTKDGDQEIIAAVETNKGWWIKHCVIEDGIGLCVVGDMDNEPAGWDMKDITHWLPFPKPPKEQNDNKQ